MVSLGGTAAHDTAKTIALLATNGEGCCAPEASLPPPAAAAANCCWFHAVGGKTEDYDGENRARIAALPIVTIGTQVASSS